MVFSATASAVKIKDPSNTKALRGGPVRAANYTQCIDEPGWSSSINGRGCDWYEADPYRCSPFDTDSILGMPHALAALAVVGQRTM